MGAKVDVNRVGVARIKIQMVKAGVKIARQVSTQINGLGRVVSLVRLAHIRIQMVNRAAKVARQVSTQINGLRRVVSLVRRALICHTMDGNRDVIRVRLANIRIQIVNRPVSLARVANIRIQIINPTARVVLRVGIRLGAQVIVTSVHPVNILPQRHILIVRIVRVVNTKTG